MLDLLRLRQIMAVRQHGSFARAAEALGMAQPSLSKSVARLEDELKVQIFVRAATGSELTAAGELIAERGARVIAEAEELVRDVALISGGEAGAIRIGIGASVVSEAAAVGEFLPHFTAAVAANHPNLRLHFEVSTRDRLISMLAARTLDLVVCSLAADLDERSYKVTEIFRFQGLAVASPSHPLAGRMGITVEEFSKHKSAGASGSSTNNAVLLDADHEGLLLFYTATHYGALLSIAESGGATLLAPDFVVRPYLMSGRLVQLDVQWDFSTAIAALTTRAAGGSPILRSIVGHARSAGDNLH